jgi:hypothetical protein
MLSAFALELSSRCVFSVVVMISSSLVSYFVSDESAVSD